MKTFKEFEAFFEAHPTEKLSSTSYAASIRAPYADTQDTPSMLAPTDKELEKQKEKKKQKDKILKKSRRYLPDEE
jgi:hypothetical protein